LGSDSEILISAVIYSQCGPHSWPLRGPPCSP
jgi:hypothetical protein